MVEFLISNIDVICAVLGLLIAIGGAVASLLTNKQSKVLTGLSKVVNSFPEIIKVAEKIAGTGEDKKTYVLQQAELLCKAMGFTPTEQQLAEMSEVIDKLVALSKEINTYTNKPTVQTVGIEILGGSK